MTNPCPTRKLLSVTTALGNAEWWRHYYDFSVTGPGQFEIDADTILIIERAGKIDPPKDYFKQASFIGKNVAPHQSVIRLLFGNQFRGTFWQYEPKVKSLTDEAFLSLLET